MFTGFEHAGIASPEPQKLAQWYVAHLGFSMSCNSASTVFVNAPDGSMLEILRSDGPRSTQTLCEPGIRHIAVAVDDFEKAFDSLKAKEVQFISEPIFRPGLKVVFFMDGEGNFLHLIYREQPAA
jgi:glyoxylase I family protein